MDWLTRFFPDTKFRKFRLDGKIQPEYRRKIFKQLDKRGFSHSRGRNEDIFHPGKRPTAWLKRAGHDLRFRLLPDGIGYRLRLEVETRNSGRPVVPLVFGVRERYSYLCCSIIDPSFMRSISLGGYLFQAVLLFFPFFFCLFLAGLFWETMNFWAFPDPETIDSFFRIHVLCKTEVPPPFYYRLKTDYPNLCFALLFFTAMVFQTFFAILPGLVFAGVKQIVRRWKVLVFMAVLVGFLSLLGTAPSETDKKLLKQRTRPTRWMVRRTTAVPLQERAEALDRGRSGLRVREDALPTSSVG